MEKSKIFLETNNGAKRIWKTVYTKEGGYIELDYKIEILDGGGMYISDESRDGVYIDKEVLKLVVEAINSFIE